MKKVRVVANATPLVYLSKAGCLNLLQQLFQVVYITPEVKGEVVDRGKALNMADAYVVEKALRDGWLRIKEAPSIVLEISVQKGEETVISLAKSLNASFIIIDEVRGRRAAELLGLKPMGTVGILLLALKSGLLDLDAFLNTLGMLAKSGFRLRQETYIHAVSEARKIAKRELSKNSIR